MSEFCIGKTFTSPFSQALYLTHSPPFSPDIECPPHSTTLPGCNISLCPSLQFLSQESPPGCFLSQGPTWGSKEKCLTKMYTTSGECCKACNLGEGVVQPCGVNQTVCEPCLDSE